MIRNHFNVRDQGFRELPAMHPQQQQQQQQQQQPQQQQQRPTALASSMHQQQQQAAQVESEWAMASIAYPGKFDVMLGRGGESNYHPGNLTFRDFIQEHKKRYQIARKQEKPIIALEVVLAWRDLSPPGRFLARMDNSRADSLWYDVGDDAACKRAGRTLGERCAVKATPSSSNCSSIKGAPRPEQINSDNGTLDLDMTYKQVVDATADSGAGRQKRPTGALDYIASLTSAALSAGEATRRYGNGWDDDERLQPKSKKCKAIISPPAAPPAGAAAAIKFYRDYDNQASLREDVAPPFLQRTVKEDNLKELPPVDMGAILDDCQRRHAMAMQDQIPTAEYLTRTVFLD